MHENPTWSTAYKNQLPDSAFLYVDKRACEHTDREGRSHPLSCRHFPYRNHLGTVSLSHVRNAISRAPQSNLPPSVQRQVQQKARRLLDGEGRMAANTRHSDRTWFITDGQLALVLDRSGSEQLRPLLKGGRAPSGVVLFSRPEAESEIVAWRRSGHWPLFAHKARAENSRLANRREGSSRRRGINDTMGGSVKRNPGTSSRGHSQDSGSGKFDTRLDAAVYDATLEGFEDETAGSSTEPPMTYAVLMRNGLDLAQYLHTNRGVSLEDVRFLEEKGSAGVIVFENSDGFVQVVYYDNAGELDKDWAETEEKLYVEDDGY